MDRNIDRNLVITLGAYAMRFTGVNVLTIEELRKIIDPDGTMGDYPFELIAEMLDELLIQRSEDGFMKGFSKEGGYVYG